MSIVLPNLIQQLFEEKFLDDPRTPLFSFTVKDEYEVGLLAPLLILQLQVIVVSAT